MDLRDFDLGLDLDLDVVGPGGHVNLEYIRHLQASDADLRARLDDLTRSVEFLTLQQRGYVVSRGFGWRFFRSQTDPDAVAGPRDSRSSPSGQDELAEDVVSWLEEVVRAGGIDYALFKALLQGEEAAWEEARGLLGQQYERFRQAITDAVFLSPQAHVLPGVHTRPLTQVPLRAASSVVADVHLIGAEECLLLFRPPYSEHRFRIDHAGLRKDPEVTRRPEVQRLLHEVSQLQSVLHLRRRAVEAVCRLQARYLKSEDPFDLQFLSQGKLARLLQIERTTVHRALKNRAVEVWQGDDSRNIVLTGLCHQRLLTIIVQALARRYPDETDGQIRARLIQAYGVEKLSRRSVAGHRSKDKALRRPRGRRPATP